MENKASNNEDYMESYVMDLILMDGTRAEDITAFSSREVLWPSGIVKDDYGHKVFYWMFSHINHIPSLP